MLEETGKGGGKVEKGSISRGGGSGLEQKKRGGGKGEVNPPRKRKKKKNLANQKVSLGAKGIHRIRRTNWNLYVGHP